MFYEDISIQCPYCGEPLWLEVYPEESVGQKFIYDCEVCCRPIKIDIYRETETGELQASSRTEDEV